MPVENDNSVEQLKQIKQRQEAVNEQIQRLKETADAQTVRELEEIEQSGWSIVIDLDKIAEREDKKLAGEIERNTILARMVRQSTYKPTKIGNCVV